MKRWKRNVARTLAMFLAAVMVLSGSGMTAFAEEIGNAVAEVAEESTEESATETAKVSEEASEEVSEEMSEPEMAVEDVVDTTATIEYSGDWGESVHWTLDSDGVLTITQDEGVEYEYFEFSYMSPWEGKTGQTRIKKVIWGANCFMLKDGEVLNAFRFPSFVEEIQILDCVDTAPITNMEGLFADLSVKTLDISKIDTSNVKSMKDMFSACQKLEEIKFGEFETCNVTDMSGMFARCASLETLDFSCIETEKVTDMNRMFAGCSSLKNVNLENFDTHNVTDMSAMFSGCSSIELLDLSSFDTSNVKSYESMFWSCIELKEVDIENFNTQSSEMRDFTSMFDSCIKLEEIDISRFKFNINQPVKLENMFRGCSSVRELNLSVFEGVCIESMRCMFADCKSLTSLDVQYLNTSHVTSLEQVFYGCSKLKELDVSNFDTKNVTSLFGLFDGCESLKNIDVSGFDTSLVTNMNAMFSGCSGLENINLKNLDTSSVKDYGNMFAYCTSLQCLDLSSFDMALADSVSYFISNTPALLQIESPTNLNAYVALSGTWIRLDDNSRIYCIPQKLTKSITIAVKQNSVTKISLNVEKMKLESGQSNKLIATIEPADATDKSVEWTSSAADIASVDSNGLVTAHKVGEATITAKALGGKDLKATCKVTVAQMATGLAVKFNKYVNADGEYVFALNDSVAPTITWDNGDPWPEVIYSVSNDTAAIEDGKLVAKKSGTGTLTATAKNGDVTGPSASVNYRVYAEKVSGIKLNADKVILDAQSRNAFLLEATIDNADVAYADVEFSVDKPESIMFINPGENKALVVLKDTNPITATVTATATDGSGKSATCTIVSGTCVNSITVSAPLETGADGAYLLGEGKSAKLTAGILPANATVKTVTWTSSDATVAKVDANGTVTAVKPGIAFITATTTDGSEVNGTAVINVTRPASAVKLELVDNESGKVGLYYPEAGSEFEVKAVLTGTDGKTDNVIQEVNYTVSGKGAKGVTYLGNGKFVATAPGVVTVTATAKDGSKVKASMQITIEQHVYAFDVQTPKNIGKYDDPRGENWIVYLGAKDVTITPSVTYNEGIKEYAPAKAYQNYVFEFEQTEKGTLTKDKKGTGIFISKDTAPGVYGVEIKNEDSGIGKHIYVAVIPADVTFIRTVTIDLPKTVAPTEDAFQPIAEGSKVKLTGVLNGGESTKGCTLTWSVEGEAGNAGTAAVSKAGVLDLSKAKAGDNYKVILNVSKGGRELGGVRYITVTKKSDASAMKLVLAENENEALPSSFNVQYVNNGKVFKVAEQIGAANLYSVTGGKKGVLTIEEAEGGYIVLAEGTGSAKLTITALDGSNAKKAITIKVVPAGNPVSKLITGSKTYSVEPNMPIAIPYSIATKNGKVASDARVEWTSSNAGILQVSAGTVADAKGSCITTEEKGYLTLIAGTGMTGKVTLTGKALDGSKKTVKVTVNVVNSGKKEVTYKMSLQTPAKTPNGGVPSLTLVTYGKSVKLTANVFPNKAKNKTISYTIVGVDANGQQTLSEAELKAKGVTVKNGVVAASKKSSYTGYVKVTATLDYMTYVMGEATPITAQRKLYVQPGVTKVEITGADGKVMKTATVEAGTNLVLKAQVTGAGTLTYSNVSWSVSDSKIASVDANGLVTIKADAKKGKKVKVTATALDGSKKKAVVTITVK